MLTVEWVLNRLVHAVTQCDWCPCKKGNFDIQKERTMWRDTGRRWPSQAKERAGTHSSLTALRWDPALKIPWCGCGLPSSRAGRQYMSLSATRSVVFVVMVLANHYTCLKRVLVAVDCIECYLPNIYSSPLLAHGKIWFPFLLRMGMVTYYLWRWKVSRHDIWTSGRYFMSHCMVSPSSAMAAGHLTGDDGSWAGERSMKLRLHLIRGAHGMWRWSSLCYLNLLIFGSCS